MPSFAKSARILGLLSVWYLSVGCGGGGSEPPAVPTPEPPQPAAPAAAENPVPAEPVARTDRPDRRSEAEEELDGEEAPPVWAETYASMRAEPPVTLSPDGRFVAASNGPDKVAVYGTEKGELIREQRGQPREASVIAFGPTGELGATGGVDGRIVVWRTGSRATGLDSFAGRQSVDSTLFDRPYGGPTSPVTAMTWGPQNEEGRVTSLLAGYESGTAVVWDYPVPESISLYSRDSPPTRLISTPDGGRIAAAHEDGVVTVFDLRLGRTTAEIAAEPSEITTLGFDPSGDLIGVGREDGAVTLFAATGGREIARRKPHGGRVVGLAVGEGGYSAVSLSRKGDLRFWDPRSEEPAAPVPLDASAVAMTRSADGLIVVLEDGRMALRGGRSRLVDLLEEGPAVTAAAGTTDGSLVAVGDDRGGVRRIDTRTRRVIDTIGGHARSVAAVAVARDGSVVATSDASGEVRLFDLREGTSNGNDPRAGRATLLAVSGVGRLAAYGAGERVIVIRSLPGGGEVDRVEAGDPFVAATFDRDGGLVAATEDGVLVRTGAAGEEPIRVETGLPAVSLSVLPDGDVAIGTADGRVVTLDPAAGPAGAGEPAVATPVAFVSDGRVIRPTAGGRGDFETVALPFAAVAAAVDDGLTVLGDDGSVWAVPGGDRPPARIAAGADSAELLAVADGVRAVAGPRRVELWRQPYIRPTGRVTVRDAAVGSVAGGPVVVTIGGDGRARQAVVRPSGRTAFTTVPVAGRSISVAAGAGRGWAVTTDGAISSWPLDRPGDVSVAAAAGTAGTDLKFTRATAGGFAAVAAEGATVVRPDGRVETLGFAAADVVDAVVTADGRLLVAEPEEVRAFGSGGTEQTLFLAESGNRVVAVDPVAETIAVLASGGRLTLVTADDERLPVVETGGDLEIARFLSDGSLFVRVRGGRLVAAAADGGLVLDVDRETNGPAFAGEGFVVAASGGNRIEVFPLAPLARADEAVTAVAFDDEGRLLFGTRGGGVGSLTADGPGEITAVAGTAVTALLPREIGGTLAAAGDRVVTVGGGAGVNLPAPARRLITTGRDEIVADCGGTVVRFDAGLNPVAEALRLSDTPVGVVGDVAGAVGLVDASGRLAWVRTGRVESRVASGRAVAVAGNAAGDVVFGTGGGTVGRISAADGLIAATRDVSEDAVSTVITVGSKTYWTAGATLGRIDAGGAGAAFEVAEIATLPAEVVSASVGSEETLLFAAGRAGAFGIDPINGEVTGRVVGTGNVRTVGPAGDGRWLVGVASAGTEVATPRAGRVLRPADGRPAAVAVTRDGSRVAVVDSSGTLELFPTAEGEGAARIDRDFGQPLAVRFAPDGASLTVVTVEGRVGICDLADRNRVTMRELGRPLTAAAMSFEDDRLVVVARDRRVLVHDLATLSVLRSIEGGQIPPRSVAVTAAQQIVVGTGDGRLVEETVSTRRVVDAHAVDAVDFVAADDRSAFVTVDLDAMVRFWRPDGSPFGEADAAAEADRVVLAGAGAKAGVFTVARSRGSAGLVKSSRGTQAPPVDLGLRITDACHAGAGRLVVVSGSRLLAFRGAELEPVDEVDVGTEVRCVTGGPTPQAVIAGLSDGRVVLQSGAAATVLRIGDAPVTSCTFTPSGEFALVGDAAGSLRLFSLPEGEVKQILEGHTAPITDCYFSPDGTVLATAAADGEVRLWAATKLPLDGGTSETRTVLAHPGPVHAVSAGPAPQTLTTASDDGSRVWSIADRSVGEEFVEDTPVLSAVIDPGGSLVTCTNDLRVRVWARDTGDDPVGRTVATVTAAELGANFAAAEVADEPVVADLGAGVSLREFRRQLETYRLATTAEQRGAIRERILNLRRLGDAPSGEITDLGDVAVSPPAGWDGPGNLEAVGRRSIQTDYNFSFEDFRPVQLYLSQDQTLVVAARQSGELPDGRLVRGRLQVWDVEIGPFRSWEELADHRIDSVEFVGDRRFVITRPDFFVFDLATGRSMQIRDGAVVAVLDDGERPKALMGLRGEPLKTLPVLTTVDLETGEIGNPSYEAYESWVTSVALAPDGETVVAAVRARDEHRVLRLATDDLRELNAFSNARQAKPWHVAGAARGVISTLLSADGGHLAVYSEFPKTKYELAFWRLGDESRFERVAAFTDEGPIALRGGRDWAHFIDDSVLFMTQTNRGFAVADAATGRGRHVIEDRGFSDREVVKAVSGDGRWLATAGQTGDVKLWRTDPPIGPFGFRAHIAPAVGIQLSEDGKTLATCGEENEIHLWDISSVVAAAETVARRMPERR